MHYKTNKEFRFLVSFIAILILLYQVYPIVLQNDTGKQNSNELSFRVSDTIINDYIVQSSQYNGRINLESSSSCTNFHFDKFGLEAARILINSNKIFKSEFSFTIRYSSFLTVVFSTST